MIVTAGDLWKVSSDNAPIKKKDGDKFLVDLSSIDRDVATNNPKVIYWNSPKEFLGNLVSLMIFSYI